MTRRFRFLLPVIPMLLLGACGDAAEREADPAIPADGSPVVETAAAQDNAVLGTIEATVDGEPRTWYVLEGTIEGERQPAAIWFVAEGEETATAGITAYDRPDVPFETFVINREAMQIDYGDYEGGLLTVTFEFTPGDEGTVRFSLPEDNGAAVVYVEDVAAGMTMENMYGLEEGTIEVTEIEAERTGVSRFAGSFSGTLWKLDQSVRMTVTDGRIEVSGARYQAYPGGD